MIVSRKISELQITFFLFLFNVIVFAVGVIKVGSIFWGDSLYYYAYTRSIVMDHDIDFLDETLEVGLSFPNAVEVSNRTGLITNKFSPGTSLFWIPGFVLGQIVSVILNYIVGYQIIPSDGTSILSQFIVGISAVFFSTAGLWFVYQTLKLWFDQKLAVFTVFFLFISTPLFYYTAIDPVNSHSISFFLSAVLLFQTGALFFKEITWKKSIQIGLISGLIMLVRNQDAVIVLPVLLLLLSKKETFLKKLNWLTLFCGTAFIVLSIQIFSTLHLFGVLGSPYLIRGERLDWFHPNFLRVLFSYENGLFFFAPILLIAIFFCINELLVKTWTKKQTLYGIILVTFLLQLYVIASWSKEIIGGPYGSRMFVSVLPHLAFGIANFIEFLLKKFKMQYFWIIYFCLGILFFLNITIQTMIMLIRF